MNARNFFIIGIFGLLIVACAQAPSTQTSAPLQPTLSVDHIQFNGSDVIAFMRQYQHHGDTEYYLVLQQPALVHFERHYNSSCDSEVRYLTQEDQQALANSFSHERLMGLYNESDKSVSALYVFGSSRAYEGLYWSWVEPNNLSENIRTPHFKIFDENCSEVTTQLDNFLDQHKTAKSCCNPQYKGTGASMPNPASVYCGCIGGQLTMKEEAAGTAGYCTVDGKETDEWQLFRDQCHIE